MEKITREAVLNSPGTHNLTKDILKMTVGKDPVDAVNDMELALMVLKSELETIMGQEQY